MVLPILFSDFFSARGTRVRTDRLVARCWWLLTMSLMASSGLVSLLLAYRGLFAAFAGAFPQAAVNLLVCLPFGAAAFLLARHRVDLVCD